MKKVIVLLFLIPFKVSAQKSNDFYSKGKVELEKKNFSDAFTFFSMAGNDGNKDGILGMGTMIVNRQQGAGVDYSKAIRLFQSIASPQYPAIYVSIGYAYFYDELYRNNDSVLHYFKLGYKYHSPKAAFALGKLYFKGEIVEPNPILSEKYFLESLNDGMPAYTWLGTLYLKERKGLPKNVDKAIKMYEQGIKNGDVYSMAALGEIYYEGVYKAQNIDSAFLLFNKAKDGGNYYAFRFLSNLYSQNKITKYYNPKLSQELFNSIKDNADAYELGQIGTSYKMGMFKDYDKAKTLLTQAYKKGEKSALLALAGIYQDKYNENDSKYASLDSAILYMKEALKNGLNKASLSLGQMYSLKDYFIYDSTQYYYEVARRNGIIESYYELGRINNLEGNNVQEKFDNDLNNFNEVVPVAKRKKDEKKIVNSIIKSKKDNIFKAKEFYQKALGYFTEGYKLTKDEKYKNEISNLNIFLIQFDEKYKNL